MNIIDISKPLIGTPEYEGDPETRVDKISSIENGDSCNLTAIYSCLHTATHSDAPSHFCFEGENIDEVDLQKYIGQCTVIEVPAGIITAEYVENNFPKKCARLLIKGHGKSFFMESAAYEAVESGICLIGTDANSIGIHGNQAKPHRAFLGSGVAVLEGLDLEKTVPGDYFLIAPPVKIGAVDGAPVRAVLISDYILWNKR